MDPINLNNEEPGDQNVIIDDGVGAQAPQSGQDSGADAQDIAVPFSISSEFTGQNMSEPPQAPGDKLTAEEFLGMESQDSGPISYADASVREVPIGQIVPNPYQPRKNFDEQQLRELADSIREHGVIQPLVVNQTPDGGYELVVGERRFRASQLAGLTKVPVIVKSGMADQQKLEVALIENIQRQELNPIEEAQAYDKLMKMFGMTQEKVAQKVGKSRPAVANTVRLLNLPVEIQRGIIENKISEGHARAILGLTGVERQLALYKMIVDQTLNVRQVESKVRELMARPRLEAAGPDPRMAMLESALRSKLGTQVKIEKKGRGGKIMIEFFSDEELDQLIGRIEGN